MSAGLVIDLVIPTYNPGTDLAGQVARLVPQVRRVVVVDDGSTSGWPQDLPSEVHVERLGQNGGIAAALNHGVRLCLADGADAVLTLDQDSALPARGVEDLERALVGGGAQAAFAVPEYFGSVRQVSGTDADGHPLAKVAIQSGLLLPRSTVEAVGLFRDSYFIDLVDTEYGMRCHAAGLTGVVAPGLRLTHRLGAQFRRRAPWGRVAVQGVTVLTLSSPFRYYYRARNRVLLNREGHRGTAAWRARDALIDLAHFAVVVSLARPRRAMARLLVTGWKDGRRGRGGAMPASLRELAGTVRWAADEVPPDEASP